MSIPVASGLTVADLPPRGDDERFKRELVDGELFVSPKGPRRHQHVIARIAHLLIEWADADGGEVYAEPDVYYTDRDYVIPDVVLVSAATLARITSEIVDRPPDLVVEVSSASTRRLDLTRKLALYEREGVAEYWFVDLDVDRIEVRRLDEDGRYGNPLVAGRGDVITPPHLPGLEVDVDDALGRPQA